jgi:predicted MFS family arabinose efflux permease
MIKCQLLSNTCIFQYLIVSVQVSQVGGIRNVVAMEKNASSTNQPRVFSFRGTAAALWIGSTGLLILGLQPVLLGALLDEGRVDFNGLALIATLEILAIGIGSVLFAFLFSPDNMRIKAGALLALAAIGQFLTGSAADLTSLLIIRGLTGLVEGGLVAVAVELIARSATPERTGGFFVLAQTLAQSILAALLALLIVPTMGASGGFRLLAFVTLISVLLLPFLPSSYGHLPKAEDEAASGVLRARPIVALLIIFSLYLFIGSIWAFLEPLGARSGLSSATVGLIVSITLLVQVCGAITATFLEARLKYSRVLGAAAGLGILLALGFAFSPPPLVFWVISLVTGFIWLFVVPWQIGITIVADDSRKTALLVPAAQLFGAALGPAGANIFMTPENVLPAAWFGAGCATVSLVLVALFVLLTKVQARN